MALAKFKGFDIASITYPPYKGDMCIGYVMMANMGLIIRHREGYVLVPYLRGGHPPPLAEEDVSQPDITMGNLMAQMQLLDVHMTTLENVVGVLNYNMDRLNHNLYAYFASQGFAPPPYPPFYVLNQEDVGGNDYEVDENMGHDGDA